MMGQLGKRLIFSAIFVTVAAVAIFWAPSWVFFLVVEFFILCALNEFFELAKRKGVEINRIAGLIFGGLLPFSIYFQLEPIVLLVAILCFFALHFRPPLGRETLVSTAVTIFGIIYVSLFFSYMIKIHRLTDGAWWVFYALLLVKGGDAGAYFMGKNFGKHKLIENVSPNKSVEGSIAEFVTIIILSVASGFYLPEVPLYHLVILGVIVGIFAQIGDLGESLLKREVVVKDSGHIPGLGGFLDMLDSLLLTVPVIYYYLAKVVEVV